MGNSTTQKKAQTKKVQAKATQNKAAPNKAAQNKAAPNKASKTSKDKKAHLRTLTLRHIAATLSNADGPVAPQDIGLVSTVTATRGLKHLTEIGAAKEVPVLTNNKRGRRTRLAYVPTEKLAEFLKGS